MEVAVKLLKHADFGLCMQKSQHELWGWGDYYFLGYRPALRQGRELLGQRKSRGCIWDRSRQTEKGSLSNEGSETCRFRVCDA
jgi:hypothetical protein